MKNLILASTLLLSITGLAQAADMPLKAVPLAPVFTWTGLYLGADAGYGWNSASGSSFCTTPGGVVNGFGCSAPGSETLNLKGGFVGGQVGYNLQTGLFVWGIEADIQVSGINQTATTPRSLARRGHSAYQIALNGLARCGAASALRSGITLSSTAPAA
jgi:outer membrane immunogenic protein